ncbi:hypothetical protein ALC57_14933, partial [Trachymyrmex cornetzi]
RGAGKSSRAANCPPSYPPYTLSHTLARNHPYPPLPPLCFPPTRPSHPTHTVLPPPCPAFPARSLSSFTIFHRSSLLLASFLPPSTRIARVFPSFLHSVLKHHRDPY